MISLKTFTLLFVSASAFMLAPGCNRSSAEIAKSEPAAAAEFKVGHGLKLTPTSSEFIGLATAEFSGRLPSEARLRTVQGDFVYVANGDWLLRTPVVLGSSDGASFGVKEGLYEGDRVVVVGVRALWMAELHFLRAGQACAHGH